MTQRTSILIPSYRRPFTLRKCLAALARQSLLPGEVLIVWQEDDTATRDLAQSMQIEMGFPLRTIHSEPRGVVRAENTALDAASGEIILLIDDDAIAPVDWLARHLSHYADPSVGAVGGPAVNFHPDGTAFPKRAVEPVGKLAVTGRAIGNMFDHVDAWRNRKPIEVDHLVGYNMSLRRIAFDRFEEHLRAYWQMFELEACLQVRGRGFRVLFDFGNVVEHHPTNATYASGREGDLQVKVYNAAYNHSYILSRHRRSFWQGLLQQAYLYSIGTTATPGLLGALMAMTRYGKPARECAVLWNTWKSRHEAQRDARKSRSTEST